MKGIPHSPGIYSVTHVATRRRYIGSATDLSERLGKHRAMLRGGYHFSKHLQAAFNLYGEDAFAFEVVETCFGTEDFLAEREQYWVNFYKKKVELFNKRLDVASNTKLKIEISEQRKEDLRKSAEYMRKFKPYVTSNNVQVSDVITIMRRFADGESSNAIAKDYGLWHQTVLDMARRTTWGHVDVPDDIVNACAKRFEAYHKDRLTKEESDQIVARLAEGASFQEVADEFGARITTVHRINRRNFGNTVVVRKYSDETIATVWTRAWSGEKSSDLAKEFGMTIQVVSSIKHGHRYTDVTSKLGNPQSLPLS